MDKGNELRKVGNVPDLAFKNKILKINNKFYRQKSKWWVYACHLLF